LIVAENLSVHFRRRRGSVIKAVDSLTLHVREGDFFALLGENGAGKSTAMHAFLGLIHPTHGLVRLRGEVPRRGAALFERVAYIPEEPHYPEYLTVEESLDNYAGLLRKPPPKAARLKWIDRLGLGEFRDLRIAKCSKGMKQKVGIAQALLNEPALLLLDEPKRGLDPTGVRQFRDVLVELNRNGTTVVMNSHILAEVEAVASRVAILKRGRVVLEDDLSSLLHATSARVYIFEVEGSPELPPFVRAVTHHAGTTKGEFDAHDLSQFMTAVTSSSVTLLSCAMARSTLEDSFFAVLRGAGDV
jgi:ABC-2 type transport system ATP-binding protein